MTDFPDDLYAWDYVDKTWEHGDPQEVYERLLAACRELEGFLYEYWEDGVRQGYVHPERDDLRQEIEFWEGCVLERNRQLEQAISERDAARAALNLESIRVQEFISENLALEEQRDEARESAGKYHEAWQEARAVLAGKAETIDTLEAELKAAWKVRDEARAVAFTLLNSHNSIEYLHEIRRAHPWIKLEPQQIDCLSRG